MFLSDKNNEEPISRTLTKFNSFVQNNRFYIFLGLFFVISAAYCSVVIIGTIPLRPIPRFIDDNKFLLFLWENIHAFFDNFICLNALSQNGYTSVLII